MRRLNGKRERGVALLVVLSTLALITSVVVDFQYNSRVDLQLALNARDELQAEYNALSALKLRAVLLKNSRMLTQAVQGLGLDPGMVPPVGQLLEMVPVECSMMSAIVRATSGGGERENGEHDDFFKGECQATSKSEHAKISISLLRNLRDPATNQVATMLLGFLSDPKMKRHFEEDDANGSHAENPTELVGAIADWIDPDKNQAINNVGDEDRFYAYIKTNPYKAKNAPFDSSAELQLVHGIDDELYEVLRDRVSVYTSAPQIELATADDFSIALGLCSAVQQGASCDFLALPAFWTQLKAIRDMGAGSLTPMNIAVLTSVIQAANIPVDASKLGTVFSDKNSTTWYTINAEGRVGNAQKRVTAVYQTQENQFYYYRVD